MVRTCGSINWLQKKYRTGEKKKRKAKERWEENIRLWTGLDANSSQKSAQVRQRWQKIVADVSCCAPTAPTVPAHRNR